MIKKTDLFFTDDGDFHIDTDHDIGITDPYYRAITQEIKLRLDSSYGEIMGLPFGANLSEFEGKPIESSILTLIKNRVIQELTRYNLMSTAEFRVEATFIGRYTILIIIGLFDRDRVVMINHRFSLGDKK